MNKALRQTLSVPMTTEYVLKTADILALRGEWEASAFYLSIAEKRDDAPITQRIVDVAKGFEIDVEYEDFC